MKPDNNIVFAAMNIDLRTYMATQFMAAMLAGGPNAYSGYNISADAVNLADELITELNKEK